MAIKMVPKPLSGIKLLLLTLSLGLGTFIEILDISIANVSISYIAGDLAVSPTQGTWVITSFAISNGIVLAITGWLSKRFGPVRLFYWSTFLFAITSWLCGIARDLPLLILFRTLQGFSSGSLIPLSQALLIQNYPEERRSSALGLWGMIVVVAPILGPVIGGWITDNYGWPWIFYINIPLALFSGWLTWYLISDQDAEPQPIPIDRIGLLLLALGVSALQISLDKGQELDWFNSVWICSLLVVSFLCFTFFIPWNLYSLNPVMDFSFFRHRNFTLATFLTSTGYLLFFGSTVLLPLWLVGQMNYTAFWAGVAMMPIGILPLFFSTSIGKYLNQIDARWFSTASFLCFSVTFYWFSNLTPDVSLFELMLPRFFQGIGVGLFFIPMITIALSDIPKNQLTSASSVFNFIRLIMGGGFGTAIFVTLWQRREIYHHAMIAENITVFNPLVGQFYDSLKLQLGIPESISKVILDNTVAQQASLMAVNDIFWLTSWILLSCIPFIWLCENPLKIKKTQDEISPAKVFD